MIVFDSSIHFLSLDSVYIRLDFREIIKITAIRFINNVHNEKGPAGRIKGEGHCI
jgi:hypothetical protein